MPPASDGFEVKNLEAFSMLQITSAKSKGKLQQQRSRGGDRFSAACSLMNQPSNEL